MADRIQNVREEVRALYAAELPGRADWADWIYEGHVLKVAQAARDVAIRFGGDPDLAEAAGLLHDIADAVMKREDPAHEARSVDIARDFLQKAGFTGEEIKIIVEDAMEKHGCHDDVRPATTEGKALSSGDAVVHLTSDFYVVAERRRSAFQSREEISAWVLPKIDRDFHNKIAYSQLREEMRPDYERLKYHFRNS